MPRYSFKFYDGQTFVACGDTPRDALKTLGLGAYNSVAYDVTEIAEIEPETESAYRPERGRAVTGNG